MYRSRERREYTPQTLDDYILKLRDFLTAEGLAQQLRVTFPQFDNDLYSYIEKLGIDGVSFAGTTLTVSPAGFQRLVERHQVSLDKYTDWIIPQLQASEEQTLELEISSQIGLLQTISWICSLQQAPVPGANKPSTGVYRLNGQDAQPVVQASIQESKDAPVLRVVTMGVNRGNANTQPAELKQAPVAAPQRPPVEQSELNEQIWKTPIGVETRKLFSNLRADGTDLALTADMYPNILKALASDIGKKGHYSLHGLNFQYYSIERMTVYAFEKISDDTQKMIAGQLAQRLENSERLETVEQSKKNKRLDVESENEEVAVAELVQFVTSLSQMSVPGYGLEIDSERMPDTYALLRANSFRLLGKGRLELGRFALQDGDNFEQFYLNFQFEYGDNPESIAAAARAFLSELMS